MNPCLLQSKKIGLINKKIFEADVTNPSSKKIYRILRTLIKKMKTTKLVNQYVLKYTSGGA